MTWFLYVFDVVGESEPDSRGLDPTIYARTQAPTPVAEKQPRQSISQSVRGGVDPRVKPEDDVGVFVLSDRKGVLRGHFEH
jgi:hypothetical protein